MDGRETGRLLPLARFERARDWCDRDDPWGIESISTPTQRPENC